MAIVILSSGCFEILEEIKQNSDGSGHFSYLVNMSQSRDKINAILKLDSAGGLRIPKQTDIDQRINIGRQAVAGVNGITNVQVKSDYDQYIFSISFDFDSLETMNRAAAVLHEELSPYGTTYFDLFTTTSTGFTRHADAHTTAFLANLKRKNPAMLKSAKYTTVYRFDRMVSTEDNHARVAGNQRAIMYQKSVSEIAQNTTLLEQHIHYK